MQDQDDRKKRLEEMVNKNEETTKRTTIILDISSGIFYMLF